MKMCTVKILVDILTYVATGKERREGEKWTRLSKSQLE